MNVVPSLLITNYNNTIRYDLSSGLLAGSSEINGLGDF